MAKLTKEQIRLHNQAESLLAKDILSYEEKIFVYNNWNEGANTVNSAFGAFFTPFYLAQDFNLEVFNVDKIIDLCAGIGMLSFIAYHYAPEDKKPNITCVELNCGYIEVGKKLLPEATWIQGSVLDKELIESLGHFNQCISNPPFGKIKGSMDKDWLNYKGSEFEFKVMEIASKIADLGTFIVPQMSTPFKYSGANFFINYQDSNKDGDMPSKVSKFIKETGFRFHFNTGIDTSTYLKDWKGVSPMCEIVSIDYSGKYLDKK